MVRADAAAGPYKPQGYRQDARSDDVRATVPQRSEDVLKRRAALACANADDRERAE